MLEIAKSNNKTSNNSIKLVVAALTISVARLVAIALALSIARLAAATLAIAIIAAPFKLVRNSACKAASYASSAAWTNYIKGILSKLVNLIVNKF